MQKFSLEMLPSDVRVYLAELGPDPRALAASPFHVLLYSQDIWTPRGVEVSGRPPLRASEV